jgi:type 1 glutamine amidotransferase
MTIAAAVLACAAALAQEIPVLIVDGQNNHNYKAMTPFMKAQLEKTGLFKVDVSTTPPRPSGPPKKGVEETDEQKRKREEEKAALKTAWDAWRPDFSKYKVVVSNYNGEPWPAEVRKSFEAFVAGGGGFHAVHAANNAFPEWKEYNLMIGLGWRGASFGKRLCLNDAGETVVVEAGKGPGAGHGSQHEFIVTMRDAEHPIVKGFPKTWLHTTDELYHGQRGPAEKMQVLATAFSAKEKGGTGDHEPMLWVIPYGKGQGVTNVMGHENGKALQCAGFVAILNRSVEWLATGKVTQALPADLPTAERTSVVK